MQFSIFSTGFLVAIMASTALAAPSTVEKRIKAGDPCHKGIDCCYSSRAACQRQQFLVTSWINCNVSGASTYCSDVGVTKAQCDADCCSISTGFGRGCPA